MYFGAHFKLQEQIRQIGPWIHGSLFVLALTFAMPQTARATPWRQRLEALTKGGGDPGGRHPLVEQANQLKGKLNWRMTRVSFPEVHINKKDDFLHWLLGSGEPLTEHATMNCDQCLNYLHYRAGLVSKTKLQEIYKSALDNKYIYTAWLANLMGLGQSKPLHTEPRGLPPGAIIFFDKGDHFAVSIGDNRVASLLDQPNDDSHLQILPLKGFLSHSFRWQDVRVADRLPYVSVK